MIYSNYFSSNTDNSSAEYTGDETVSDDLVLVSDVIPNQILIAPATSGPVFPGVLQPIPFSGQKFIDLIRTSVEELNGYFGMVMVKEEDKKNFFHSELYKVGTVLKIYKVVQFEEAVVNVLAQGIQRFSYIRTARQSPLLTWEVEYHPDQLVKPSDELKSYALSIISSVKELLKTNSIFHEQLKLLSSSISLEKPGTLMDLIASVISADSDKLQDLLETFDLLKRGEKLLILLQEEIELTHLQEDIQRQIQEKMSKHQREFFLREQLRVIKKELGMEKDDKASEIEKIENRIKNLALSSEAAKVIQEELEKLQVLETSSAEFHVTRGYLNTLTELPWGIFSDDNLGHT
ncbi:LON peptidase substrate-binding domain-containing protein [Desulfopila sp. IMCC35008]|uniref:LON peptidase substrate-binding domain-containing protein n=1 Tax=Desulfopila sp. IMCC35008 TaxID=2653858 RepID=UPI00197AFC56|nr:LON peptidase substrate-binding domain-containing protein [Desulfopila sp. IMCC35008]